MNNDKSIYTRASALLRRMQFAEPRDPFQEQELSSSDKAKVRTLIEQARNNVRTALDIIENAQPVSGSSKLEVVAKPVADAFNAMVRASMTVKQQLQ